MGGCGKLRRGPVEHWVQGDIYQRLGWGVKWKANLKLQPKEVGFTLEEMRRL